MTGPNRFLDDMSRLMTNAMGVAQGARDEAETTFKGWIDRWLADRNFVTREEFEAVREMAVKARTENAELRAAIQAMGGLPPLADTSGAHSAPGGAHHPAGTSEVEAPPSAMTAESGTTGGPADGTSEAEAPPSAMTAGDSGPAGTSAQPAGGADAPVSEVEAPPSAMTAEIGTTGGPADGTSEAEAPPSAMTAEVPPATDADRGTGQETPKAGQAHPDR